MVVDDEMTSVVLLKKLLTDKGYEVITAMDGMEGFVKMKEERPDVICLDVHMPNLDGVTLITDIRNTEELKDTPIIVISGDEQNQERFKHLGIAHFFQKPYDSESVLNTIETLIQSKPIGYD